MNTNENSKGYKLDQGKLPIHRAVLLNFPHAMESLAAVSSKGFDKYPSWDNWKHVPDGINKFLDATVRHLVARAKGEILADDTGFSHYKHALWNLAAVVELEELEEVEQRKQLSVRSNDRTEQVRREATTSPAPPESYCPRPSENEVPSAHYW